MKKIFAITLSAILLFSAFSGCSSSNNDSEAKVWTVDINEKILQDNVELYSDYYGNNKIEVFGAQNEKESGQFTITAIEGDVNEYNVTLSDLKSSDGDVFSKDNIELFNQKYYAVGGANEHYTLSGMYPDAILPFEKAVEYGENKVEENHNQSVMVRFDIPENQPAGLYTGSLTVTVDGSDFVIPVSLRVYGVTVSEEVHSRSAFAFVWQMEEGEFDYSLDIRKEYYNFLAEYLVSGSELFAFQEAIYYTDEVIEIYCDFVAELYENPKISSIRFPKLTKIHDSYTIGDKQYNNIQGIDLEVCQRIFNALIDRCVKDGVDYMSKLIFRGMDEPQLWGNEGESVLKVFHNSYLKLVDDGKSYADTLKTSANNELIEKIKASMGAIPVITTYGEINSDIEGMSYCPYFHQLASEAKREEYLQNTYNELWWYGCNVPIAPAPTYHIDDSLLSARIASWMQYDYGIVGNLYWAVDAWESTKDNYNYYDSIQTPLEAGEGVLLYPGKPYGLSTPVASLRLEAIRDGLEEYELLRSLDLSYKAVDKDNYSIDALLELLGATIYNGANPVRDIDAFNTARKSLYDLCELASQAGFMITGVDIVDGEYTVDIYAKNGCEIKSHNELLTPNGDKGNDGKEYTVKFKIEDGITGLDFDISYGGKNYTFDWYLASSSNKYLAEDFADAVKTYEYSEEAISKLINASELGLAGDDKYLQIGVSEITSEDWQILVLSNDIISSIGENTRSIIINVYYDAVNPNDKQYFELSFKYESEIYNNGSAVPKIQTMLVDGFNEIEIPNIYAGNWAKTGAIEHFEISFSQTAVPRPAVTNVYIKDFVIFDK